MSRGQEVQFTPSKQSKDECEHSHAPPGGMDGMGGMGMQAKRLPHRGSKREASGENAGAFLHMRRYPNRLIRRRELNFLSANEHRLRGIPEHIDLNRCRRAGGLAIAESQREDQRRNGIGRGTRRDGTLQHAACPIR